LHVAILSIFKAVSAYVLGKWIANITLASDIETFWKMWEASIVMGRITTKIYVVPLKKFMFYAVVGILVLGVSEH